MSEGPWHDLYDNHPERYEDLVQAEDYQGQLLAAMTEIAPLDEAEVVELGAGTGRITVQLLPRVRNVRAFDLAPGMLGVARRKLERFDARKWSLCRADSRAVPLPAGCADLAVEGWSFLQIMAWHMQGWQQEVGQAIGEMERVVRPGGTLILVETLGTGATEPDPPAVFLPALEHFEGEWGFTRRSIRTDYCFPTLERAHQVVDPIFPGVIGVKTFACEAGIILPECTGVWWKKV